MRVEIDISGKFDQPQLHTILAMGGGYQCALLISKKEKKKLWELVNEKERSRGSKQRRRTQRIVRLFGIMCFLIIQEAPTSITQVAIDFDYSGHEGAIRADILNYLGNSKRDVGNLEISFDFVGKGPAHKFAKKVIRKNETATHLNAMSLMKFY